MIIYIRNASKGSSVLLRLIRKMVICSPLLLTDLVDIYYMVIDERTMSMDDKDWQLRYHH